MKTFRKLYKKTSTGAIQYWFISVLETPNSGKFYDIETEYGQVGTGSPQITTDMITTGKNIGKKNETSVYGQAVAEAQAKWEKQKKKGYVETQAAAEAGELDALIEGGISPMLAHKFNEQGHKIKYPAYVQPKLDGIRCVAMIQDGKCRLWSRTRKPISSMPHIVRILERAFPQGQVILDGELYNHAYKTNFEHIVSMVRQEEAHERHEDVEYHVYDIITEKAFTDRAQEVYNHLHARYKTGVIASHVIWVPTLRVDNEQEAIGAFEKWRADGFEGAMIRNGGGLYVNKRSYDLQKIKEFDDSEFPIIGIEEGRGKLQGHVGAFVCRTKDGKEFLAKMSGDTSKLKEYFQNHKLWQGKILTVQYQGLTGKEGVPRFPVGVAIRDYE